MNKKNSIILAVLAVVILVLLFFLLRGAENRQNSSNTNRDSSGLIVGNNAVYVSDQKPGNSIKASVVRLEKPGFLVIHEDKGGNPGDIIGSSQLLPIGQTQNLLPITLSIVILDGQTIYAMLHIDNGDSIFKEGEDKPAIDPVSSQPVMMAVAISSEAVEPGAVNP